MGGAGKASLYPPNTGNFPKCPVVHDSGEKVMGREYEVKSTGYGETVQGGFRKHVEFWRRH